MDHPLPRKLSDASVATPSVTTDHVPVSRTTQARVFLSRLLKVPDFDTVKGFLYSIVVAHIDPWDAEYYYLIMFTSLADVIYLADMWIQARKGYLEDGILVIDLKRLVRRYVLSKWFLLDLVSMLPLALFHRPTAVRISVLRLNRILRWPRLSEFMDRSWRRLSKTALVITAEDILYLVLIIHLDACIYYSISDAIGFGSDKWVLKVVVNEPKSPTSIGHFEEHNRTLSDMYLASLFWACLMLTKIAEVEPPERIIEYCFHTVNVMIGILIFASVVGSIASIISGLSRKRVNFHNWVGDIRHIMNVNKIDTELQLPGMDVDHLDASYNALECLPEHLQIDVNMSAHSDTLKRVRLFQDCDPGLLRTLVNKLQLVMYNPGEYVCRKGDVGKEMYIIKMGQLSVVGPDGVQTFATLSAGAIFGELSLLNIPGTKTGNRRTASIRSNGYSYLFFLSKEDLWAALEDYPDARRVMVEKGRRILIKDGLLDEATEPVAFKILPNDVKVRTLSDRISRLTDRMSLMTTGMTDYCFKLEERLKILERRRRRMKPKPKPTRTYLNPNDLDS